MVIKTRDTKNSSYHKAMILALIKEKQYNTISEFAKYLGVSRPTIYEHLKTLERRGLITKQKNETLKGAPVKLSLTSKAKPLSLGTLENAKAMWDKTLGLFNT